MNDLIRRELPSLRRFARALVGRQAAADRLVATALEAASAEIAASSGTDTRLLLLRALLDARSAPADPGAGRVLDATVADEAIVAARVRALPAESAVALLLATLDGLGVPDIAFVMRLEPAGAEAKLREAQLALDRQVASDVLIIEDEPVIAMDVAGIVRQAGHRVLGIASTCDQAVAMALRQRPDLVLADIQLADDSSGIRAVDAIVATGSLPVVFITAYPERLLEMERAEPSLLITKPFSEHLLKVAIAQALQLAEQAAAEKLA
jgi:CheY-like chemotaxis protein/DNA-directed RNA polymerase specialized sigma24 family protein